MTTEVEAAFNAAVASGLHPSDSLAESLTSRHR
jgi:hypothetical protein